MVPSFLDKCWRKFLRCPGIINSINVAFLIYLFITKKVDIKMRESLEEEMFIIIWIFHFKKLLIKFINYLMHHHFFQL